jgi:hypothetical protein
VAPTPIVADVGLTATVATGAGFTVIAELPLFPSLVAVMFAVPAATPLTSPVFDTVATAVLSLPHVTTRPFSTFPFASNRLAVSCCVVPVTIVAAAGLTVTVATGADVTVIAAVPFLVSLLAVMVADPEATAVTTPAVETVATAVLELDHVTTRSSNGFPLASSGVAVSVTVPPGDGNAVFGVTTTDATAPFV